MNLKQIEAFRTVMATGSTIAASALLNLSQSAISRQLAQLEADLGFELFLRSKGRLVPTPEARALLEEVEDLTEVLGRVRRTADDLRAGAAGRDLLKIAVAHSLATTAVPAVVRRFLAERPKMAVEIHAGTYDAIERMVASRAADIGFIRLPASDPAFEARPLLRSGSACVMPRGHPLARLPAVTPRDLAGVDMVLLGRQRSIRQEIDATMRVSGTSLRCRVEAHSVATACALVAQGLGVSIVSAFMAEFFRWLPIEIRPFDALVHDFGVITLPGAPPSRAADAFIEMFRDTLVGAAERVAGGAG